MMTVICCLLVTMVINAKVTRLHEWTSNTWGESEHGDSYWADTYTGTVSINGSESYREGGKTKYPRYIWLTYDVQGDITKVSAYSEGTRTIQRSKTVKDKWNFGPKTKAYVNLQPTTHPRIDATSVKPTH